RQTLPPWSRRRRWRRRDPWSSSITPRKTTTPKMTERSPWELEVGSWAFAKLVRRLRRLRLFVGDVLDGAVVRDLQPLGPVRVVHERLEADQLLALDHR